MSPDELFVLFASLAIGPIGWTVWFYRAWGVDGLRNQRPLIWGLVASLIASVVVLGLVLTQLSAPDVKNDTAYLLFYFLFGLAWIRVCEVFFKYAGVSVRDDVIERRNAAAVPVVCGALIGATCCFAGGNIGAGPGWWVVAISGALATSGLAVVWIVVGQVGGLTDLVTIDRDRAAGWRLGGLLVATGLILGRAVAGDWHELGMTIVDFVRLGWGAAPLAVGAMAIDRVFKPAADQPQSPVIIGGAIPALIYVTAAVAYVVAAGWPT